MNQSGTFTENSCTSNFKLWWCAISGACAAAADSCVYAARHFWPKQCLLHSVLHLVVISGTRNYRVAQVIPQTFPKWFLHEYWNSPIDGCHSDNQIVPIYCILSGGCPYTLGGLFTIWISCLMLQRICSGRCCSLLKKVAVLNDVDKWLLLNFKAQLGCLCGVNVNYHNL